MPSHASCFQVLYICFHVLCSWYGLLGVMKFQGLVGCMTIATLLFVGLQTNPHMFGLNICMFVWGFREYLKAEHHYRGYYGKIQNPTTPR